MATVTPTVNNAVHSTRDIKKATWAAMVLNDVGSPFPFAEFADRSVQVLGTFGAAGNLQWQGSNDAGTTWATLTDPQGNALDFAAAKIEAVTEMCELARPKVTAGDGTTSLTVVLVARKAT